MPRISYNDILACLICENYRCIPWFRGSCSICERPHRLRNGDAALAAAGGPRFRQTTSRRRPQASAPNSKRLELPPLGPDHVAGLGSLDTRAVGQHIVGVGLEALRAAGTPGHGPSAQRAVLGMLGAQQLDAEELGLARLVRRMLRGPVLAADRAAVPLRAVAACPAGNASASTMGVRGTSGSRPENARMSGRR